MVDGGEGEEGGGAPSSGRASLSRCDVRDTGRTGREWAGDSLSLSLSLFQEWPDESIFIMDQATENNVNILLLCDFSINLFKQPQAWNEITSLFGLDQLVESRNLVLRSLITFIPTINLMSQTSKWWNPATMIMLSSVTSQYNFKTRSMSEKAHNCHL